MGVDRATIDLWRCFAGDRKSRIKDDEDCPLVALHVELKINELRRGATAGDQVGEETEIYVINWCSVLYVIIIQNNNKTPLLLYI